MDELEVLTKRHIKKRRKVMMVLITITFILILGTSFALWQITLQQTSTNKITTGCLDLRLTNDTDAITINDAVPTSDEEGKNLVPYTFTIENTCNTENKYIINLETLNNNENTLANHYIKASLITDGNEVFINKLVSRYLNEEKVNQDALEAYKLHEGILNANERKTYSLRLWIANDINNQEEMMNKIFSSKITVTASYVKPTSKAVMGPFDTSIGQAYDYITSIDKIVIDNKINISEDAYKIYDFSKDTGTTDESKKVVGMLIDEIDETGNEIFTLHIQGNGGVVANEDSSRLFYKFQTLKSIEGLENLDTRNVTNMANMFESCQMLTSIDLSNLDTSKVTNMSNMFYDCQKITNLDLRNFNTENVIDMEGMFNGCISLVNIDLTKFNTNKVTNMNLMFNNCSNLVNLDLNNFDTSNVNQIMEMFNGCSKIITTLTIRNSAIESYTLGNAATLEEAKITLNYTSDTENIVDAIIEDEKISFPNSNIIKGTLVP